MYGILSWNTPNHVLIWKGQSRRTDLNTFTGMFDVFDKHAEVQAVREDNVCNKSVYYKTYRVQKSALGLWDLLAGRSDRDAVSVAQAPHHRRRRRLKHLPRESHSAVRRVPAKILHLGEPNTLMKTLSRERMHDSAVFIEGNLTPPGSAGRPPVQERWDV